MKSIFKYLILVFLYIISTYLTEFILKTDDLFYSFLAEQYSINQINKILNFQEKWEWLSNIIIPIFILLKTTIVASVLYIGTFFFSKVNVTFKQLWEITVGAEFIFVIVSIVKIIWFYFFQNNYSLEDLQYYYPLSALSLVGYKGLDTWFIYPLQTINFFELAYWLVLAYFIGKITSPTRNIEDNRYKMDFGLKIVATSYGSALLLWICVMMFFTLNNS